MEHVNRTYTPIADKLQFRRHEFGILAMAPEIACVTTDKSL